MTTLGALALAVAVLVVLDWVHFATDADWDPDLDDWLGLALYHGGLELRLGAWTLTIGPR